MAILRRKDLIEVLAERSGWTLSLRESDRFLLASSDPGSRKSVQVRGSATMPSVLFQHHCPTRFSLERTPHLIFARLMMRSYDLTWSAWIADISDSTEAVISLVARVPREALNLELFRHICAEMRDEARAFDRELRDKLDYLRGFRPDAGAPTQNDLIRYHPPGD